MLLGEVTPKTRLLALSHVCWVSGNRLPVEELKEATGLPLLVDGAQSVGAIPVDAREVDYYAFSCQKWLCGPDGMGGLAVREPERLEVLAPSYLSQDGYEPTGEFTPRAGAGRFDPGWTPPASLAGLDAALDVAPDGRFERAAEMTARCRELLAERAEVVTAPEQGTLVSFAVEGDSAESRQAALRAGRDRARHPVARLAEGLVRLVDERGRPWSPRRRAGLALGRPETELARDRAHRGDDERDVLVELDPELLGALVDLLAG